MSRLFPVMLILTLVLPAQIKVIPHGTGALQRAQVLERQGKIKAAREIYYSILETNPNHRQAFKNLKNNLMRDGKLEEAAQVSTTYLNHNPQDIATQVDLGELYYLMNEKERAFQYWTDLEQLFNSNQNYYRTLVYTFARLSLTTQMDSLAERGRQQFNDPAFLAVDLANFYHSRGAVSRAVDEFINHLLARPKQQKYVTDRILLLSDNPEILAQIEAALLRRVAENEALIQKIIASFYFKIQRYGAALDQHRAMGLRQPKDYDRWLEFAGNLRSERQYDIAISAYQTILHSDQDAIPSQVIGAALLGMGQCFEDQIVPRSAQDNLVRFYPDNLVFENHFYGAPIISTAPLENSFRLYDSVLVKLPRAPLLANVYYRLGEIKYRITRDFDGAFHSYQAALKSSPKQDLKLQVQLRIGDIKLAKGNTTLAQEYFLKQLLSNQNQSNISPFLVRLIQANLLAGDVESALTLAETTLQEASPNQPYFNDLMEIQDLITTHFSSGTETDRAAFLVFLQAENLVRQNKLSQSVELLGALRMETPESTIVPWVTLRAALLNASLNKTESALDLANALDETPLADLGLTLTGEIYEAHINKPEIALIYYHRLLEEYPQSILVEPVRFRIRELNQNLGS